MSHVRPWIWIRFWNEDKDAAADGDAYSIRPHAVHASLLPDIVADIHQRYPGYTLMNVEKAYPDPERRPEENNPHAITELTMDVGGMWIVSDGTNVYRQTNKDTLESLSGRAQGQLAFAVVALGPARDQLSKELEEHTPFDRTKLQGEVRRYQRSGWRRRSQ